MDSPALCALAADACGQTPTRTGCKTRTAAASIDLWYRLLTAFAQQEMEVYTADAPQMPTVWYPSVGCYPARQGAWVLGAKMGSNGDSHNHNDPAASRCIKMAGLS